MNRYCLERRKAAERRLSNFAAIAARADNGQKAVSFRSRHIPRCVVIWTVATGTALRVQTTIYGVAVSLAAAAEGALLFLPAVD